MRRLVQSYSSEVDPDYDCKEFDTFPKEGAYRKIRPRPKLCAKQKSIHDSELLLPTESETNINDNSPTVATCSDSSFQMMEFLCCLETVEDDLVLIKHGYEMVRVICNTLQGELIEAAVTKLVDNPLHPNPHVAIKKIDKMPHINKLAEVDGMTFCVETDIVKEAMILKHLTVYNRCTANNIENFIDFFEGNGTLCLVVEYIESNMNLEQFVIEAHEYMESGKLKRKEYLQIIKYIFWEISVVLHWMHNDMHC